MWFVLDKQYEAVGVLDNSTPNGCPYFRDTLFQQLLNGYERLEFEVPSNHKTASLLELEGFVVHISKTKDKTKLFRIKEIEGSHGVEMTKKVFCETASTSDLMSERIRPIQYTSATLKIVMENLLNGTGWELGECYFDGLVTMEIGEYPTALEAIHSVIAQFEAEIEFTVEFNGISIVKKLVNLYEKRGQETNVIFEYESNLKGLRRIEKSAQPLFTAMIGIGKEVDGVKMTVGDYTGNVSEPFEVVGDYIGDKNALNEWGLDGKHIYGVHVDNDATHPSELYASTLRELKKYNKPQLQYEVDVAMLERITGYSHMKVEIGDTIMIKDRTFNPPLFLNARVLNKDASDTDETSGQVTLGEFVQLDVRPIAQIQKLQRKINMKEDEWNRALQEAQEAKDLAENSVVYRSEISSTNGIVFKNGQINTVLVVKVYKNNDDITDLLHPNAFMWSKTDKDGNPDTAWDNANQGVGKSVAITSAQVQERATFRCNVDTDLLL